MSVSYIEKDITSDDSAENILFKTDRRIRNQCMFGCVEQHSLKKCPVFNERKKICTPYPYLDDFLRIQDVHGFCAAGILPYVIIEGEIYMFLLLENRGKTMAYNFAGGGRELTIKRGIVTLETPYDTAKNEFIEEVGELIGETHTFLKHVCTRVYQYRNRGIWSGRDKYICFPINVYPYYFYSLTKCENTNPKEAHDFAWIPLSKYKEYKYHKFTYTIIKFITQNMERIFEEQLEFYK